MSSARSSSSWVQDNRRDTAWEWDTSRGQELCREMWRRRGSGCQPRGRDWHRRAEKWSERSTRANQSWVPPRTDPRSERFSEDLSEPIHNMDPTFVQCYPAFWVLGEDAPCIAGIGNWLDPTTDAFVTRNNIQLVVNASGSNPRTGHKPPSWGYGLNRPSIQWVAVRP